MPATRVDQHPGVETVSDEFLDNLEGTGLAPEDFEIMGMSESMPMSATNTPFNLAGGEEADMAFVMAEEERAAMMAEPGAILDAAAGTVDDELPEAFVDNRQQQGTMVDYGMDVDATMHREAREWEAAASEFGVDDRTIEEGIEDVGEAAGLDVFGGGVREDEDLLGY